MPSVIKYDIQEGKQNRVESGKRNNNLILQLFPFRHIDTAEANSQEGDSPTVKIIQAIDQYNPRHIRTEIRLPHEKADIPFYTIEFKDFYSLPTDTNYLRDKITKALRDLEL
jgi:hypothetical protein